MPEAQNRGSVAAPGMRARKASENSPSTIETLTPAFSIVSPRRIAITPPPPPGRCHGSRTKRAGGRAGGRAVAPESRSAPASRTAGRAVRRTSPPPVREWRRGAFKREACGLAQGLADDHRRGDGDVERSAAVGHRHPQPGIGRGMNSSGHAAALPADHDDVVAAEAESGVVAGGLRRQQNEPRLRPHRPPRLFDRPTMTGRFAARARSR